MPDKPGPFPTGCIVLLIVLFLFIVALVVAYCIDSQRDATVEPGVEVDSPPIQKPTPPIQKPEPEPPTRPVGSDRFRSEMMEYVFRPCFLEVVKNADLAEQVGTERALSLLLEIQKKDIEDAMRTTIPMLDGKTLQQRLIIYEIGLVSCLNGAGR